MGLKNLNIEDSYESTEEDIVNDFYIPALKEAKIYKRIVAYYSSSSLLISACGIAGLIDNGGHMELIASPVISRKDANVIQNYDKLYSQFSNINLNNFVKQSEIDHVKALGWMLRNGYLEIKFAEPRIKNDFSDSIFHEKIGVLIDKYYDAVSFSGSINETANAWISNIEEFKVFRNWIDGQKNYYNKDLNRFDKYWNNIDDSRVIIKNIPEAFKEKLIKFSDDFDKEKFCSYYKNRLVSNDIALFPYQRKAMRKWEDSNYRLIFEMATGTGKTRTAIACISKLLRKYAKFACIISTPQDTLSRQWLKELETTNVNFSKLLIADSTERDWKDKLPVYIKELKNGFIDNLCVLTTHKTSSSENFISVIKLLEKFNIYSCFVADEAHGLGAQKYRNALQNCYDSRIALSATPNRWFDESGSKILLDYFGSNSFEFTIKDALSTINPLTGKTFLVQYFYFPVIVSLTSDELEHYIAYTKRMMLYVRDTSDVGKKNLKILLTKRSNIIKKAKNKLLCFDDTCNSLLKKKSKIDKTIVFVNEEQLEDVINILQNYNVNTHRFTQNTSSRLNKKTGISEREAIIDNFKKGELGALVAINCLNEGIDIPSADTAIILASSTNPREYIQRIGRVIRQSPNKKYAYLYDFVVKPNISGIDDRDFIEFEKKIYEKEKERVLDMARNSLNYTSIITMLQEI